MYTQANLKFAVTKTQKQNRRQYTEIETWLTSVPEQCQNHTVSSNRQTDFPSKETMHNIKYQVPSCDSDLLHSNKERVFSVYFPYVYFVVGSVKAPLFFPEKMVSFANFTQPQNGFVAEGKTVEFCRVISGNLEAR